MQFLKITDYVLNLAQVSDINCEDPESWEVHMASGRSSTLEAEDLETFKAATGL